MLLFYAATFLVSYNIWRIGSINLTFSDVLFTILLVVLAARSKLEPVPLGSMTAPWMLLFATMIAGLFLGSLVNGDLARWGIVAGQYTFSLLLLPMIFLAQPRTVLHGAVFAFVAGVTSMEVIGIAAYYLFPSANAAAAFFGHDFVTPAGRLGSFVGEANWNGVMIAMALQYVIYCVRVKIISQPVALAIGTALAWALLLTGSFTAFSAALIGGLINVVVGRALPSAKVVVAAVLLATFLWQTGYRAPDVFTRRVGGAYQSGDLEQAGTFTGRKELVIEAWRKVEDTTIVGMGVDRYREWSDGNAPVHNIYLLLWAEGGVFALVGWLGILFILFMIPISVWRIDRLAAALGCSTGAIFVIVSIATPHMFGRLWIVPFLIACGIALRANRYRLIPLRRDQLAEPGTEKWA
jgi:O-antigen ligase